MKKSEILNLKYDEILPLLRAEFDWMAKESERKTNGITQSY